MVNTESVDDYLKALLELSGPDEQRVSSNALAERLDVRAASVTGMLQKLAALKPAFVRYEKHHGAILTSLHDILDFPWDEVHEEAERLEHFISERLEDRIAAKLGDPQTDPHGHSIPERNGTIRTRPEVQLPFWACGVQAVISSVSDRDPSALREMERLGLLPGVELVVETGNRGAALLVRMADDNRALRLNNKLAGSIYVVDATSC